ncbi:MAG: cytochrome b N-terminal domain-containing protein [Chloroflexi bacterium]|nr:cytochrome b N-terminal domain-containing protein [Chloroflexota bacterium]
MRTFLDIPARVWDSFHREPHTHRPRRHPLRMIDNLFLHVHPNRVSPISLRPTTTLGLGLITASFFIILVVTGVLLMFYYVPAVPEAYERMQDLIYVVRLGRVTRDLHRVAAEGMVVAVFLHALRAFYTAAYKPPREFNWLVGLALLTLTLALSFTGYLLPWDQLAYWAITVSTGILSYYPLFGEPVRELLLGDRSVGQEALLRFYVLHVFFLPAITFGLIGYHIWRTRKDGGLAAQDHTGGARASNAPRAESRLQPGRRSPAKASTPAGISEEPITAYPLLLWIEIAVFLAVLLVSLGIAIAFPGRLDALANADHPPNPSKAPWYFIGLQELVSYSAAWGGVVVPIAVLVVGVLLPYVDRDPRGAGRWFAPERRGVIALASAVVIAWLAFTFIGAFARGPNWVFYWPGQPWPGPG